MQNICIHDLERGRVWLRIKEYITKCYDYYSQYIIKAWKACSGCIGRFNDTIEAPINTSESRKISENTIQTF